VRQCQVKALVIVHLTARANLWITEGQIFVFDIRDEIKIGNIELNLTVKDADGIVNKLAVIVAKLIECGKRLGV